MTTDREFADWLKSLRPYEGEPDYTTHDADDLTPEERWDQAHAVAHYASAAH